MKSKFAFLVLFLGINQLVVAQNVSFSTTSYSVFGATTVAVGDFNNDGIPDLVVATATTADPRDPNNGHVVILLGIGDGTFKAPGPGFLVTALPQSIAVGDFNGDGNLDLAVTASGLDTPTIAPGLSILLGNGDGTFQPETRYQVGGNRIAVADINGDGIPDLIFGAGRRGAPDGVFTMLGKGDGTFQDAQNWVPGCCSGVVDIAIGDFNGDGVLDVVGAREGDRPGRGDLIFLAGNGDGTFQPPVSFDNGFDFDAVVGGDFNSDGILDVIASDNNGGNGSGNSSLIYGNGDGTFSQPFTIGPISGTQGLASADFNSDGNNDVAVAAFHAPTVHVLLGDGQGDFQDPIDFGLNAPAFSIAAADLNGDGKPDLALVIGGGQLVVMLNTTGQ